MQMMSETFVTCRHGIIKNLCGRTISGACFQLHATRKEAYLTSSHSTRFQEDLGQLHLDQSRVSKRSPTARVQPQQSPDTTGICSLRHRALMGSEEVATFKLGVSQFTKSCVAPCPCFVSCNCCNDPFIVRSAQTVHHSLVSLS